MPLAQLKSFVTAMTRIAETASGDEQWLNAARPVLATLVAVDDWLPDAYAVPDSQYYRQYLLHCDPLERFSVVSFVWGPGQRTPIHDHTVWGLIGMLRGEEISTPYAAGKNGGLSINGDPTRLVPGQVESLSPVAGDIHQVRNAFDDRVSISIHVYGGNIGAFGAMSSISMATSRTLSPVTRTRQFPISGTSRSPLKNSNNKNKGEGQWARMSSIANCSRISSVPKRCGASSAMKMSCKSGWTSRRRSPRSRPNWA
jgi:3-mercaptopropionate dioxygenase